MPAKRLLSLCAPLLLLLTAGAADPPAGTLPADASGKALNLDFEDGTYRDWTATGDAFGTRPVEGDAVFARRKDMHSRHEGKFWAGSFETRFDDAKGTLTSRPFVVSKPFARFLIAGGQGPGSRVELVRDDTKAVVYRVSGDDTEEMKPVAVDLSAHVGKPIFIRLVDEAMGGWGHINFDDFRLFDTKPAVPQRPGTGPPDVYQFAGLGPQEAARAMTVPEGFHVTLFAGEPDVVQPIAFAFDDRGRLWVAEAYSYPRRVPQAEARDRILIFEDKDGDGHFDSRKVFADNLNLVSGLEVGFGGVWVGAAPEFYFIPDKDGDDRPDGPPQVLLDGWGAHDTHETLNSFAWGPDGWLYGCHGVFTHSRVGKPGTPDAQREPINAGIWRYHPTKHKFEVFAHGTSNPWGIDWDANGQAFLTSCVIPHLYHVIQGGRYERQAGPHFNPYNYDDIKTIADHRHYVGGNPHAGNGRSDSAGGGHAHAGAMIYQGGSWPAEYVGSIFMNNIHGARLNRDILKASGSGFVGSHAPDFLMANDSWSQVVSLKYGPDGSMYMIDWYDKNQCHRNETELHDRTNGRIFRVAYGTAKSEPVDLKGLPDGELVALLTAPNRWQRRHARRLLQERAAAGTLGPDGLKEIVEATGAVNDQDRLEAFWTLHATAGLNEQAVARGLSDASPPVVGWTIQLALEDGKASAATLAKMADLAKSSPSPVVRLYLASGLQRLPLEKRWDIVAGLLGHAEDAQDPNLPFMDWFALEPLAASDPSRALKLALGSKLPNILPFTVRRIGAIGSPSAIALLVEGVGKAEGAARLTILKGLNEALKGRRQVAMPEGWPGVFEAVLKGSDEATRSQATALAVTFGDPRALEGLRVLLVDRSAHADARRQALESLLKARATGLSKSLRGLLGEADLRGPALRGLAAFDDPETPKAVLEVYGNLSPAERRDALNTLASRTDFARALLGAVGEKKVPATDLSADVVRQLRNLKDSEVDRRIADYWGTARDTSADRLKRISQTKAMLQAKPRQAPDVTLGRAVYAKTCRQCHTLFGAGGKVGPEITGSNRADLDYILSNVLDPSALIGKDYIAHVLATADGRVLTGIIRSEDKDAITLVTANETVTIPRAEVEGRKPSDQSMMPEDLLTPLSEHEVRSLVAYLASPAQVPMKVTKENIGSFFNGRDLTGWQGDAKLWSVEGGEIVGRSAGLKRNEFLRSDLAVADFTLTVDVRLVKNEGNSGVQFRSEALPDGEMKGYQADVGVGWWGKLYEENGRTILSEGNGAEAAVKKDGWNRYVIEAHGPKVRTTLNGKVAADLDDPPGRKDGIFAIQLHSGGPTEVRVRLISLETPEGKWEAAEKR